MVVASNGPTVSSALRARSKTNFRKLPSAAPLDERQTFNPWRLSLATFLLFIMMVRY